MKSTNQTRLDRNVADTSSIPTLSQIDELRAADAMSHELASRGLAEIGQHVRRRAAAECFRADLVQRLRMEIAWGTYPDDDKLSIAVKRMYRALVSSVDCALGRKAAG